MESKELRLGNLFIEENSNKIIEVIGLEKNRVVFSGMFLDKWQAKPIALTEEWIFKFGFEKLTSKKDGFLSDTYTYKKGISFIVYFDGVRLSVNFWQGSEKKYVHELQNFFFALTGAELTVA
jgi:hypothetical protein